jgi:hypothetical protein
MLYNFNKKYNYFINISKILIRMQQKDIEKIDNLEEVIVKILQK